MCIYTYVHTYMCVHKSSAMTYPLGWCLLPIHESPCPPGHQEARTLALRRAYHLRHSSGHQTPLPAPAPVVQCLPRGPSLGSACGSSGVAGVSTRQEHVGHRGSVHGWKQSPGSPGDRARSHFRSALPARTFHRE